MLDFLQKEMTHLFNQAKSTCYSYQNGQIKPGAVAHTCNPIAWEAEAGGPGIKGQPRLHETLFQKTKSKTKQKMRGGFNRRTKKNPGEIGEMGISPYHGTCEKYHQIEDSGRKNWICDKNLTVTKEFLPDHLLQQDASALALCVFLALPRSIVKSKRWFTSFCPFFPLLFPGRAILVSLWVPRPVTWPS